MCGIYTTFATTPVAAIEAFMAAHPRTLHPRGPDAQHRVFLDRAVVYHARLAITGASSLEPQPFRANGWTVAVNGEIYNHVALGGEVGDSDCAVLTRLLDAHPAQQVCRMLDGVFSFVAYDAATQTLTIARDPIGVTPLFYGTRNGVLHVSSLLAALPETVEAHVFPPGHVAHVAAGAPVVPEPYAEPYRAHWEPLETWEPANHVAHMNAMCNRITWGLRRAVQKRLMGDTPWGVLLSGGLDSTIIAALASKLCASARKDYPRVHSFSVGLHDSPDLAVARRVALELDTVHHELVYTVEEGIAALRHVIGAIETYDVTTVRASTPMYLLARFVRQNGVKMVLSGEGADELFAGYKYNEWCPSPEEMMCECARKMNLLHAYDCLRANKSMGAFGVECRVPFLDQDVVDLAMNQLHPAYKMTTPWKEHEPELLEKWVLRRAFANLLPGEVADRAKAQFSDAVGDRWIAGLRAHAREVVGDVPNAEETLYRQIFCELFPNRDALVVTGPSMACSTPAAVAWGAWEDPDPSGNI